VSNGVKAFTISLMVYPVIATGLLYHAGRVGPDRGVVVVPPMPSEVASSW
jgi:hypothetical protein